MSADSVTRVFRLQRNRDVTGYSGAGIVADGCVFPDGQAVLRWRARPGKHQSTEIFDDVDQLTEVHGHGDATRLEWV